MKTKFDCLSKDGIIRINKKFDLGTIRDEGAIDYTIYKTIRTRGVNKKVAILLVELTRRHPFVDGNKRTAIECAKSLLILHGRRFVVKDSTVFDLVYRITSNRYSIKDTVIWIGNHTK